MLPPRAITCYCGWREGIRAYRARSAHSPGGVSVLNIWGGTAGNWGRRDLDLDEMEIMIVGCKTGEPMAGAPSGATDQR